MKWQPRHATGIEEIDQQHKMLFETADQFRQTLEEGGGHRTYDLFLEALTTFTEVHFTFEEECMFAYRCPAADRNKSEHAVFTRIVQAENERFAAEGFSYERATALLNMVDGWLDGHIGRVDIELRTCVEQK